MRYYSNYETKIAELSLICWIYENGGINKTVDFLTKTEKNNLEKTEIIDKKTKTFGNTV